MTSESIASTPLTNWHRRNGGKLSPFAGFEMPIHYGSIVDEHNACRNVAALFDVSHMGRLRFDGAPAAEFLDSILTRRVTDMSPGDVRYALICDQDGGVLDDVLVYYVEKPSGGRFHMLVVNASNRSKITSMLEPKLYERQDMICTDRTELTSMIAVQGPAAMDIAKKLLKRDPHRLGYYKCCVTEQFQKPVLVSRTGYTGEDGLELVTRAEDANRIWENLMLAGRDVGIKPAGLGARDTLRLEAAMPLYGHELDETIDPITAGLSFACNLKDREFIGSEPLLNKKASGTSQARVGILPEGSRPAREGCGILNTEGQKIGTITSGTVSPTLGYPIAMGYVDKAFAEQGTEIIIDIRGKQFAGKISKLPFYKRS